MTPAERANATMLAARLAERPIPRLTRTIAVTVRAGAPGGSYNDAYADDIALVPRVPRLPGVHRPGARAPAVRRRAAAVAAGAGGPPRPRARAARVRERHGRDLRRRRDARPAALRRCSARLRVALQPGRVRRVRIPLSRRARRSLARRRTAGHVYAAARDGQGLTRTTVAPVRIVPALVSAIVLLVVDVGNTQTHFGTFRDGELVEHWRFATVRQSTADELGAALRSLLDLRGVAFDDLTASIVSSTVPSWGRSGRRWPTATSTSGCPWSAPACGPGWRSGSTTRARSAPTAW